MSIKPNLRCIIQAIKNPVMLIRTIDTDGTKRLVVIRQTLSGRKALGKFEVAQEFAVDSYFPAWRPVEFRTANDFRKKTVADRSQPPGDVQEDVIWRRFIPIGTEEQMDKLHSLIAEKNLSREDLAAILRAIRLNPDISW